MGAGTLDLSLIEYAQGVLEVKAIEGEEFLGGDDFDEIIIKWIVDETKKTQGFDPIEDQQFKWHHIAALRLREAAEYAKIELSSQKRQEFIYRIFVIFLGIHST
jgi:molecular chaperone DnaK